MVEGKEASEGKNLLFAGHAQGTPVAFLHATRSEDAPVVDVLIRSK